MGMMVRDLLCKLRAQITFALDGTATLKLRIPEAKTLILMVAQEERGMVVLCPREGLLRLLSFPSRF
jgi:hypothetical protein